MRVLLLAVFAAILSGCTNENPESLKTRALSSSAVFIGVVEELSTEPITSDVYGGLHQATLRSERIFGSELGEMELGGLVSIPFRQHMSHWVDFQLGHRYLVFLAFCSTGPQLVGIIGGAVPQRDEGVVLLPGGDTVEIELFQSTISVLFSSERASQRRKLRALGCGTNGNQT